MDRRLRYLAENVSLWDPGAVKRFIAEKVSAGEWSQGYAGNVANAYDLLLEYSGLSWEKPSYERVDQIQKIPKTEDINKIISGASLKYAVAYSIIRDTGARPIEASRIRVKDIDREKGLLYPRAAKKGQGRILKLKSSTVAMINRYVAEKGLSESDLLFGGVKDPCGRIKENWIRTRNRVAEKLGEPGLRTIKLYDLRHHFATKTYVRTKDIVYVQRQMGHKNIHNTLGYLGVIDLDSQEFTVKVASSVKESTELIEQGFEYVATQEGMLIYRKPKL